MYGGTGHRAWPFPVFWTVNYAYASALQSDCVCVCDMRYNTLTHSLSVVMPCPVPTFGVIYEIGR